MKVIKAANVVWTKEIECSNCKTLLEVETKDLKFGRFYSGMDAQESVDFYTKCMVCKENIFFDEEDIPAAVKFVVEKRHPLKD